MYYFFLISNMFKTYLYKTWDSAKNIHQQNPISNKFSIKINTCGTACYLSSEIKGKASCDADRTRGRAFVGSRACLMYDLYGIVRITTRVGE